MEDFLIAAGGCGYRSHIIAETSPLGPQFLKNEFKQVNMPILYEVHYLYFEPNN